MFYIKKCISDRHYILRYPEFSPEDCGKNDHAKRKELRAIGRMNDFYSTMRDEILAYCTKIASENPKAVYLMDFECTVSEEAGCRVLSDSEGIPLHIPITVRVALVLRNRPNPTRRQGLIHTWQGGYLVK